MEKTAGKKTKSAGSEKMTPRELRRAVKLAICLGVFGLAAAAKLLFPGAVDRIRDDALDLMGRNVDYRAAMEALGEAAAGEKAFKDAMAEAYRYAFYTGTGDDAVEAEADTEPAVPEEEPEIPAEEATEYLPPDPGLTVSTLAYVRNNGREPPEDASYDPLEIGFDYVAPVSGTVTSHFGYRDHPVDKVVRFHYGTDIGAETGAEICSFADGTVYAVGEESSLGKYIAVDHPGGVRTVYGHCSEITVKDGDTVKAGQKIGEVGSTGNATGSCLHFEIRVNGIRIDPEYYIA